MLNALIIPFQLVANKVSSSLRYSPQSACLKHVIPVGSNLLASAVLLAVTPNPNGVSFILYTTTPESSGSASVKRTKCRDSRVGAHTLMFRTILRPSPHMRLHDMSTIQERHFAVRFNPDFVAYVFGEDGEGGDVQPEFSCLCELAYTDVRTSCSHIFNRGIYLDKSLKTVAYLSRSKSPGLRAKGARSSSAIDGVGKRIGQHWARCQVALLGASENFQYSLQALQTESASRFP